MNADEIAARFDARPGYSLVDYGEVGLPLFLVSAVAIVQEAKSVHPIEEFVMRCATQGLGTVEQISGFLGLEREIIERTAVGMIQEELITIEPEAPDQRRVVVLHKGRTSLSEAGLVRPEERTISFPFDGLTRKPKFVEQSHLMLPRELKEAGIPEIPALPARGPEVSEVNVLQVEDVLTLLNRGSRRYGRILKLKRFESRSRWFLPAVALVYRAHASSEFRVSFAVSGRLSEEHERAFAAADGLKRSQRFAGLGRKPSPISTALIDRELGGALADLKTDPTLTATVAKARVEVAEAARKHEEAATNDIKSLAATQVQAAKARLDGKRPAITVLISRR